MIPIVRYYSALTTPGENCNSTYTVKRHTKKCKLFALCGLWVTACIICKMAPGEVVEPPPPPKDLQCAENLQRV